MEMIFGANISHAETFAGLLLSERPERSSDGAGVRH